MASRPVLTKRTREVNSLSLSHTRAHTQRADVCRPDDSDTQGFLDAETRGGHFHNSGLKADFEFKNPMLVLKLNMIRFPPGSVILIPT